MICLLGLDGFSWFECHGRGIHWASAEILEQIDYHQGVKLEIICQNLLVEEVIGTIEKAAHTGLRGDGKIYATGIEQAVRISTGERGGKGHLTDSLGQVNGVRVKIKYTRVKNPNLTHEYLAEYLFVFCNKIFCLKALISLVGC